MAPDEHADQGQHGQADGDIDQVAGRQHDRRAAHIAVQLGEGDQRAGEGHGPDGHAQAQLDQAFQLDAGAVVDVIGDRRIDGGHRHQTGRQAHQAVEGGHQLRHGGHGHAAGDHRADGAADQHPAQDHADGDRIQGLLAGQGHQGHGHGDGHAQHAQLIAPPAGHRAGQPAQGEDEQDARDQIGDGGEIGVHDGVFPQPAATSASSCTWPAFSG